MISLAMCREFVAVYALSACSLENVQKHLQSLLNSHGCRSSVSVWKKIALPPHAGCCLPCLLALPVMHVCLDIAMQSGMTVKPSFGSHACARAVIDVQKVDT